MRRTGGRGVAAATGSTSPRARSCRPRWRSSSTRCAAPASSTTPMCGLPARCRRAVTAPRSEWSATASAAPTFRMERSTDTVAAVRLPRRPSGAGRHARSTRRADRCRGDVARVGRDRRGDRALGSRGGGRRADSRRMSRPARRRRSRRSSPAIGCGCRRGRSSRAVPLPPSCWSSECWRRRPSWRDAARVLDAYAGVGLFAVAATAPDCLRRRRRELAIGGRRLHGRTSATAGLLSSAGRWVNGDRGQGEIVRRRDRRSGAHRARQAGRSARWPPPAPLCSCSSAATPSPSPATRPCCDSHGYRHESTDVVDLFPGTHHVETVTRFTLRDRALAD